MKMREILFRGKCIVDFDERKLDTWVYGYFVYCASRYDDPVKDRVAEIIELGADRQYIGEYSYWDVHKVDPDTVSQWTGLVDKNGTKIFEGDILHIHNDYNEATKRVVSKVIVEFKDGAFVCDYYGDGDSWNHFGAFNTPTVWFEVVGNKWDNPELVDGKAV